MSYGVFARYYDALTGNVEYGKKARYLHEIMQKYKPGCSLIVDLACGTGNLSVELAGLGYDVIGVDISPDMLMEARNKGGEGIMYLCQPMQKLDLYGTVDAVVCILDSVNHITKPEVLQTAFGRVSLFLEPDGVFIFDANTLYKHEQVLGDNVFIYDTDEVFCVWQNQSEENGIERITLDFFEQQGDLYQRSSESFTERAYSHDELYAMLDAAGMEICEEYNDYTLSPPDEHCERVVYVCRKKV